MSERYSKLFSLTENLYAEEAPVIISAGALLKDNQTGKVLAQLKFTNIQEKQIKALKVKIYPKDTVGNALGEPIEYQYLDLTAKRDNEFASNVPIILSDAATRSFDVEVTEAIFTDNSIWNSNNSAWERLPNKLLVSDKIKDFELLKQYQIEFGKDRKYAYSETKDLWYCACGAVNKKGEHTCHSCKISAEVLTNMDLLKESCEKRLAEEARQAKLAAEKAAEEARQNEIQKQKTKKIAMIATPILVAVIAFVVVLTTVIIPNSEYNAALALMEEQKYEEAIAAFEAMDGYKDSAEQILNCKYKNAVVLVEQKDYKKAYAIFAELDDYKDSEEQSMFCQNEIKYNDAVSQIDAGNIIEAYETLISLDGYKDSKEKANSIKSEYIDEKYPEFTTATVGDIVCFGEYEQDNNLSNGKEDIEWIVLDKQDGKILVISKYALDSQPYNTSNTAVTWETCSLREWLNYDFLNNSFSDSEKTMIPMVTVSADKNPYYSTDPGNATQDKVFLLSVTEANMYFSSDTARQCKPTAYTEALYVWIGSSNGNCLWWLRSPGSVQNSVISVYTGGDIDGGSYYVDRGDFAVRPAMWIEIGK